MDNVRQDAKKGDSEVYTNTTERHPQPKPTIFLWQLLMMTLSHFHCSYVTLIFSLGYPFPIFLQFPNYFCFSTPCEFSRGNNVSHSALFWYHDEWSKSVPVDCGLEIKNK